MIVEPVCSPLSVYTWTLLDGGAGTKTRNVQSFDLEGSTNRLPAPARLWTPPPGWSAGGAGDEGGDDVGGVAVEGDAGSVVAHGGARVGVAGGFLHVAERDAGVERGGDERVAERVGSDLAW